MRAPDFRLDGRRALVTGASSGIGLAAAHALAQAGAELVLVARRREALEAACAQVAECGARVSAWVADVTDAQAMREGIAARGPFQVLVNNAGMNRPALLVDTPDADLDAVLELNVKAAMRVAREVVRGLQAAGLPGSLINLSSQMGHVGSPRRSLYCASKHALEGFTKALAWEVGAAGIRINTLCPTFIETELTRPMLADPAFHDFVTRRIALGRVGRVEEVMGAVLFLASDASSLVTGSALMLDGGWTAA